MTNSIYKTQKVLAGCCLVLMLAAEIVSAIVVVTDNGRVEVRGYEVTRSESTLVVEALNPDGTRERRTFDLTDPDVQVIDSINRGDLEQLDPNNPRGYFDLAARLEAKVSDPEVHDLVVRLFIIAAHLDPDNLSVQGFRYLAFRGRSIDETRRFNAMLRAIDTSGNSIASQTTDKLQAEFLFIADQIAKIRIGQAPNLNSAATTFLASAIKNAGVRITLSDVIDQQETQIQPRSLETEVGLIALEVWLREQAGENKQTKDQSQWSTILHTRKIAPARPFSVKGITEFDPAKSVYSNGEWVVPAK